MTTPHPSPTQGHTPWVLRPIAAYTGERMILDAHGHYVATVQIYQTPRRCGLAHEAERNTKAEQIIRAVNSHQALVSALKEAHAWILVTGNERTMAPVIEQIETAIALATKEAP